MFDTYLTSFTAFVKEEHYSETLGVKSMFGKFAGVEENRHNSSYQLTFYVQKREKVKQLACGKFAVAALEVAAVKV